MPKLLGSCRPGTGVGYDENLEICYPSNGDVGTGASYPLLNRKPPKCCSSRANYDN